jgi:hypothetical protein
LNVRSPRTVVWTAVAVLCFHGTSTFAAPVDRLVCKRLSGGPMSSFAMAIDLDAKTIVVPSNTGLQPDPDSVAITKNSAKWSFMRGFVRLNRRSGELDWDTTAEYAYLAAIGHPAGKPESNFKGRMRCAGSGGKG